MDFIYFAKMYIFFFSLLIYYLIMVMYLMIMSIYFTLADEFQVVSILKDYLKFFIQIENYLTIYIEALYDLELRIFHPIGLVMIYSQHQISNFINSFANMLCFNNKFYYFI